MSKAEGEAGDAECGGDLGGAAVEAEFGSAAGGAVDLEFAPADATADAGAERLGPCFLGGKTGGETFGSGFAGLAVGNLSGCVDTFQEVLSEAPKAGLDALDFDEVCTDADDHWCSPALQSLWKRSQCTWGRDFRASEERSTENGTVLMFPQVLAVKEGVSYLRVSTGNPLSTLQQAPEGARTVFLRSQTGQSRSAVREGLPKALAGCGCGAPVLTETETRLTLCFDLPPEAASGLYWQMIEAALEFEGESHQELTRLCTVQSYLAEFLLPERPCTVRLEIRFRCERRRVAAWSTAARA